MAKYPSAPGMPAPSYLYSILRARLNLSPLDSSHLPRLRERQALCSGFPRGGTFLGEAILGQITPRCSKSWWFGHAGLKARKQSKVLPGSFQMKRRRPRKLISGGSKIELPGGQNGLVEASGRQVGARWPPRPLRNRFWAALGALLAAPGPVPGRSGQEVPRSSREAPVETPGGHFSTLFWWSHWRGSKIDRFCC